MNPTNTTNRKKPIVPQVGTVRVLTALEAKQKTESPDYRSHEVEKELEHINDLISSSASKGLQQISYKFPNFFCYFQTFKTEDKKLIIRILEDLGYVVEFYQKSNVISVSWF